MSLPLSWLARTRTLPSNSLASPSTSIGQMTRASSGATLRASGARIRILEKKAWRFEVALLKEEFNIVGGPLGQWWKRSLALGQSLSSWNGSLKCKSDLPAIYSCNTWWGNLLSDNPVAGVYLKPLEFTIWKSQGFGNAGMPQGLPPYRTVGYGVAREVETQNQVVGRP